MSDLWKVKFAEHPVIRLVAKVGKEEAMKALSLSLEDLDEEIARVRYQWDFDTFAKDRLKIVNKDGELVSFLQNSPQKKMDECIDRQRRAGKPVRICLLKARQWGGSTKGEGHIFGDSILRPNRSSMIVAHDLDSARHLRSMSERYYDNYDFPKPTFKRESDKWWKFRHKENGKPADSHIRIDTADELSGGHSLTVHNMHLSEIQLWRDAQTLVKGLFPTVPNSPDTFIFMEGTGSGVGNYWYDFCQMAMSNETEWEFLFIPWFEIDDYKRDFEDGKEKIQFEKDLDQDARILFEQGISLEKLHWRLITIRDTYKNDIDAFHQQYPATPDEAFITSGRPVFPMTIVKKYMGLCKDPIKVGSLRYKDGSVSWIDDKYGYWSLWEEVVSGVENLYCIGADVAEGLEVIPELGNRGSDFSAARVLRRDTRSMVATFHARVDTDIFAEELWKAGMFWNSSLLPEQNGQAGGSLLAVLKRLPGVRLIKTPNLGKRRDEKKDEYGWETMKNTRRMLVDDLNEEIREESFTDFDKRFWSECSTFVFDEKGKAQAQLRKHDDIVFGTMITFQADKLLPMHWKRVVEKKKRIPVDMDVPQNRKLKGRLTKESVFEDTYATF